MVNTIFALDIGTRTVVGVLARGSADRTYWRLLTWRLWSTATRSMFDGQIRYPQGSRSGKTGKNQPGDREQLPAAACIGGGGRKGPHYPQGEGGRKRGRTGAGGYHLYKQPTEQAVQEAQQQIQDTYKDNSQHYCVGYSVVDYYLDGVPIKSLEGHRGHEMGVEVIATFLPRSVVESLYAVMERSGLEVINLTLEPIAAITLAIPEKLRMLNLAMVDIGAGTSDIAISRNGSISAYAMVSMEDEVTDEIAQHFAGLSKCRRVKSFLGLLRPFAGML